MSAVRGRGNRVELRDRHGVVELLKADAAHLFIEPQVFAGPIILEKVTDIRHIVAVLAVSREVHRLIGCHPVEIPEYLLAVLVRKVDFHLRAVVFEADMIVLVGVVAVAVADALCPDLIQGHVLVQVERAETVRFQILRIRRVPVDDLRTAVLTDDIAAQPDVVINIRSIEHELGDPRTLGIPIDRVAADIGRDIDRVGLDALYGRDARHNAVNCQADEICSRALRVGLCCEDRGREQPDDCDQHQQNGCQFLEYPCHHVPSFRCSRGERGVVFLCYYCTVLSFPVSISL